MSPHGLVTKRTLISQAKKPRHREITVNPKPQLGNRRTRIQIQDGLNHKSVLLANALNFLVIQFEAVQLESQGSEAV